MSKKKTNKDLTKNTPVVKKPHDTKIASTIVEQGPRDDLTRVDGYGKQNGPGKTSFDTVVSKYTDDLMKGYRSLSESLGLGGLDLKSLKGMEGLKNIVKEFDPDKIKKRIETNLLGGRSMESIVGLAKDFKRDAVGTLAKVSSGTSIGGMDLGNLIKTGQMSYKEAVGIHNMVKNGDWESLAGISRGLSALGGTKLGSILKPLVDLQATSAFLGEMMNKASRLGVPGLIEDISGLFKSKRDRNRALSLASINAAMRADMLMMRAIIDILGANELRNNNPHVIKWVLENYRFDVAYNTSKAKEYRTTLLKLLNDIDPEWYFTYINNEKITKLDPFVKVSKDAKILLTMKDQEDGLDFTNEILIARDFPESNIKLMIAKQYKDIRYKNMPLDPRRKHVETI